MKNQMARTKVNNVSVTSKVLQIRFAGGQVIMHATSAKVCQISSQICTTSVLKFMYRSKGNALITLISLFLGRQRISGSE